MKISDFSERQLERLRQECNFVNEERDFFELRARGLSLVQIQMRLPCSRSKADSLSRSVKEKILRIL